MAGAKAWFGIYGEWGSDPEKLLREFSGRTLSEIESAVKDLGGRITLFSSGTDEFWELPFVRIAFEFPEWETLQRIFVYDLLARLAKSALARGTDLAFQFSPLRDEEGDGVR